MRNGPLPGWISLVSAFGADTRDVSVIYQPLLEAHGVVFEVVDRVHDGTVEVDPGRGELRCSLVAVLVDVALVRHDLLDVLPAALRRFELAGRHLLKSGD